MAPSPVVTIAVVSWNTRELLRRCLRSLAGDVQEGRADVWVVDNHSSDGSRELVASEFPWVQLICLEQNIGFGAAVNCVAQQTSTPWIAAANADIELLGGALETLLHTGERWPQAGAIGPRLRLPDGSTQHSVYAFPTLALTTLFNLGAHRLHRWIGERLCLVGYWVPERARRVDWAIGAFLLVRRTAWDAVGGFDARQWMYAEDLDLGWRLAQAGWESRYEPRAEVRHEESAATTQAWGDERTRRWLLSTYAWLLRRRGVLVTRITALVNIAGAGMRWLMLTPGAAGWPERWGPERAAARRWIGLHRRAGLARRGMLLRHR